MNMNINLLIILCIFLCILMFVYALLTGVELVKQKLGKQEYSDSDGIMSSPLGPYINLFASFFNGELWSNQVANLDEKLIKAGSPLNGIRGNQYFGLLVLTAVLLFVFNLVSMTAIGGFSFFNLMFSLLVGFVVIIVGNMWLNDKISDRKVSISREFPYFMDMSVMVMGAGSSFPDALEIYTTENPNNALGSELKIVLNENEMGKTMLESLEGFENRVESTGVQNALKAILQGERMGTPIVDNLLEQADAIRFMRSQDAERVAEQMKIKMQGPAMLLLFSVLLIILGPAVVNFKDSGMF